MLCNDVVANRKRDLFEVIQRELVSGFRYIYNELWEETLKERRSKRKLTLMYTILNSYKSEY